MRLGLLVPGDAFAAGDDATLVPFTRQEDRIAGPGCTHRRVDGVASLGWRRLVTFQPADRFWTFQGIEAAIFLALALLAIGAAVVLLRRRPA